MQTGPVYFTVGSSNSGVWIAITTAVITAFLTFGVGLLIEHYKRHRDRGALAASIQAEISTIVLLLRELRVEEIYRLSLTQLEQRREISSKWTGIPLDC